MLTFVAPSLALVAEDTERELAVAPVKASGEE